LNPWVENFVTSMKTLKSINYCALPKVKWLLIGILNNMTQSHILVIPLLPKDHLWEVVLTEKADFSKSAFKTKVGI